VDRPNQGRLKRGHGRTVGFLSFRFAGTDGVSLETRKWVDIFGRLGYRCVFMAGELDTPAKDSFLVEEAHFRNPVIREIYEACFGQTARPPAITARIHELRELLKKRTYEFLREFAVDLLIPENTLAIPLNLPLGLAVTEVIAETRLPTIAHHHDLFWERKRFLNNCVWDYLSSSYPPRLPSMQHAVINTSAQNQLALRRGIGATLIPNVMNFEQPPTPPDEYAADVRRALGVGEDELFLLQPTRVVQRKGIEHAIELAARLGRKAVLVISHASGDEGYEYQARVRDYARMLNVRALFIQELIADRRGVTADGRKIYDLKDVYPFADLVTYPSLSEGFGNAFLEAIYYRRPLLVNNYSIYFFDIKPKGFEVIEMEDFITDQTVSETRAILADPDRVRRMTETNYALCLRHYGYRLLETKLRHLLSSFWGH
jgi:glycosyltransferase involved in cell wall biosynthesis